jgi:putative chitinase
MKLTVKQFKDMFPKNANAEEWVEAMNDILPDFEINTPKRVAAFLAQCGHESAGFSVLKENLNYSADGLNNIFPKYFKNAGRDATQYARQPEKIANVVYANRMGNGDEKSGDGWRYRGRGPIQLTGKDNYRAFANDYFDDPETLLNDPDLLIDHIPTSLLAAVWFWQKNKLNVLADSGDIKAMTKRINGGFIGLEDRIKHYNHALHILGA